MVWMPSRYPCGNVICNDKEEGTHEGKYSDCRSGSGEELIPCPRRGRDGTLCRVEGVEAFAGDPILQAVVALLYDD